MNKRLIKALIKEILIQEKARPEAPEDSIFGQYLFAPQRVDKVPPEENTTQEDEFLDDYETHIEGDSPSPQWIKLIKSLVSKGQYKRFLQAPKNQKVYRIIKVSPQKASGILGLPKKEITEDPNIAFYVANSGNIKPKSSFIQSWSLSSHSDVFQYIEMFNGEDFNDTVVLLLVANTEKNNFFLNPLEIAKKIKGLPIPAYNEWETISYGPVKFDEAAFIYIKDLSGKLENLISKLEHQVQTDLKMKIPGLNYWDIARLVDLITNKSFVKTFDYKKLKKFATVSKSFNIETYINQKRKEFIKFSKALPPDPPDSLDGQQIIDMLNKALNQRPKLLTTKLRE